MNHKDQRRRARARRRNTPAKIIARHIDVVAAWRMGLVRWQEDSETREGGYFIGDRDVSNIMMKLTHDAGMYDRDATIARIR